MLVYHFFFEETYWRLVFVVGLVLVYHFFFEETYWQPVESRVPALVRNAEICFSVCVVSRVVVSRFVRPTFANLVHEYLQRLTAEGFLKCD